MYTYNNDVEDWENTPEINLRLPAENHYYICDKSDIQHQINPTSEYLNVIFNDYCEPKLEYATSESCGCCILSKLYKSELIKIKLKRLDYLAYLDYKTSNVNYMKIIKDIYSSLTGSMFTCPDYGHHWENIGFQSNHPSSDLRSFGLLTLLSIHQFCIEPVSKDISNNIFKLSNHEVYNFPFCILCMNVTKVIYHEIKTMKLNEHFDNERDVILQFFIIFNSLLLRFYTIWRNECKTVVDSQSVLSSLQKLLKNETRKLILNYQKYIDSDIVGAYGDMSVISQFTD